MRDPRERGPVRPGRWITLNNQSGVAFKDARVKLMAGEVSKIPAAASTGDARVGRHGEGGQPPPEVTEKASGSLGHPGEPPAARSGDRLKRGCRVPRTDRRRVSSGLVRTTFSPRLTELVGVSRWMRDLPVASWYPMPHPHLDRPPVVAHLDSPSVRRHRCAARPACDLSHAVVTWRRSPTRSKACRYRRTFSPAGSMVDCISPTKLARAVAVSGARSNQVPRERDPSPRRS